MRLVHHEKTVNMYNYGISQHQKLVKPRSVCQFPQFTVTEVFQGCVVEQTLVCKKCNFKTGPFQLFDTIPSNKTGKNCAVTNIAIGAAVLDSETGAKMTFYMNWTFLPHHVLIYKHLPLIILHL